MGSSKNCMRIWFKWCGFHHLVVCVDASFMLIMCLSSCVGCSPLWICSLAVVQQGCYTVFCWTGAWWECRSTSMCRGCGKGYVTCPSAVGECVQAGTQTCIVLQLSLKMKPWEGDVASVQYIGCFEKFPESLFPFLLKRKAQTEGQLKPIIFH